MRASTPIILKKIKLEEQKPFCRRLSNEIYREEVYKAFYCGLLPADAEEHTCKRVYNLRMFNNLQDEVLYVN